MATIKNQWIAMSIGTIGADYLESLLNKGASNDVIAGTAGVSAARIAWLLAQPIPAGFNGYPTATPTYSSYLPNGQRLTNSI